MKHIRKYHEFNEGISREGDSFKLDFSGDKDGDVMSLRLLNAKGKKMSKDNVKYEYYFAYRFDFNKDDKARTETQPSLLKTIKKFDEVLPKDQVQLLVNKAVIGLDKDHKLSSFDSIIYPKSSSVILKELAAQCNKKSGNSEIIPDAFVKAARTEITFDEEKIKKLPDSTRKQVEKMIDHIRNDEGEFKLKEIYPRFRKFIKDFVKFNTEEDRRTYNLVTGKKVLLIDDYRTTGTTLKEMMSQLIKLQPAEIVVFILVRID